MPECSHARWVTRPTHPLAVAVRPSLGCPSTTLSMTPSPPVADLMSDHTMAPSPGNISSWYAGPPTNGGLSFLVVMATPVSGATSLCRLSSPVRSPRRRAAWGPRSGHSSRNKKIVVRGPSLCSGPSGAPSPFGDADHDTNEGRDGRGPKPTRRKDDVAKQETEIRVPLT